MSSSSSPPRRPRRAAQPKPYALAECFDAIESDYDDDTGDGDDDDDDQVVEYKNKNVKHAVNVNLRRTAATSSRYDNGDEEEEEEDASVQEEDEEEEEKEEYQDEPEEEDDEPEEEEDSSSGSVSDESLEAEEDEEEEEEDQGLLSTAAVYHPTSKWEEPMYNQFSNQYSTLPMSTLYDIHRRPRRVPSGRWHCSSSISQVLHAFRCVICWSTLRKPKLVRECLHRFCEDCIEKSLRMGRNECPVCRVFVPSKRNLASDEGCEALLENILGPNLRNEDFEATLQSQAIIAGSHSSSQTQLNDSEKESGDDEASPRLRRPKRRGRTPVYTDNPMWKRRKMTSPDESMVHKKGDKRDEDDNSHNKKDAGKNGGDDKDDDDDDDEEEEEQTNVPALFDFYLRPHRDENKLEPLLMPHIRICGDATVATLVRFLQAKLSTDKALQLASNDTSRRLHEQMPLYLVGALTKTLCYRHAPRRVKKTPTTHEIIVDVAGTTTGP